MKPFPFSVHTSSIHEKPAVPRAVERPISCTQKGFFVTCLKIIDPWVNKIWYCGLIKSQALWGTLNNNIALYLTFLLWLYHRALDPNRDHENITVAGDRI